MPTRLHISSFVGFTILVWLTALWVQGMPVLSTDFLKPFGIVVGATTIVAGLFDRYAWAWGAFRGWYVKRPDLRGTWRVAMQTSWESDAGVPGGPIHGYAVVRQTLTTLSVRLMTSESRSRLVAHSLRQEEDGVFVLDAVYRNEPDIELQGVRSDIHHGAFTLQVYGSPPEELRGHYWTDRLTRGSMELTLRSPRLFETFESAEQDMPRVVGEA